ncbi:hypothetical protein BJY14_006840 [Actinomadura luteofluorescens]|uniref:DUF11 domain-containing protein n=1 Tax=Actinomadura luteofluorescens TaxID=46163 RepID=A0A7Y9JIW5_9ACTN|nr:hypothetical protein [Actinomadura luteofluorescens]NYD50857.1 hypothetical protein [Actinomadura luteofluorescens]
MIRTLRVQGTVLAMAAPLLGGVLVPAAAQADGPGPRTKPKPHGKHAAVVALRLSGPVSAVVPGRTYEWTFTMTARGPGKSGQARFRMRLPKSLSFVSGNRDCAAAGWTVECDLGAVRRGRTVTGAIKAKVSGDARPGQRIGLRGTVTWGRAHAARAFPAVRVGEPVHFGHSKAAPKKPQGEKTKAKKPAAKKPAAKKPHAKKPRAKKSAAKTPAAVRRIARTG